MFALFGLGPAEIIVLVLMAFIGVAVLVVIVVSAVLGLGGKGRTAAVSDGDARDVDRLILRLPADVADQLEQTSAALGIRPRDLALRIIAENLSAYEDRARQPREQSPTSVRP